MSKNDKTADVPTQPNEGEGSTTAARAYDQPEVLFSDTRKKP